MIKAPHGTPTNSDTTPRWRRALTRAAVTGALLLTLFAAGAADRLKLKDGRVLEGEVIRELDGYIWFKYRVNNIEQQSMFLPSEIEALERDVSMDARPKATEAVAAATPARSDAPAARRVAGVKRGAVLSLGDNENNMVGMYMMAEPLRRAIPLLEEDKIDIVVLYIHSGGGYLYEIQKLSDVIHLEYKKRFETVAWIGTAISAAAMTAHCLENIYFMPQGNYGACTGFSGRLNAMKGRGLEEVLYMMEEISRRGGHDPKIMRAMQISSDPDEVRELQIEPPTGALSASFDENGRVIWYQDETSGQHVLNPKGGVKVLTFNAAEAEKFQFSKGTAATLEDLTRLMGYSEIEWVGERRPGYIWPISRAEDMQMKFRAKTAQDEKLLQQYWTTYQQAIAFARAEQDRSRRGSFVGRARQELEKIKAMVRNNPNFRVFILGMEEDEYKDFIEQQERLLRDLMR